MAKILKALNLHIKKQKCSSLYVIPENQGFSHSELAVFRSQKIESQHKLILIKVLCDLAVLTNKIHSIHYWEKVTHY